MRIYDFITAHPDAHIRIIRYSPAPDVLDEYGNLICDGEGTSQTVFDSTTGEGDLSPDLLLKDIINDIDDQEPDEGEPYELEYLPDECYWIGG